MLCRVLCALLFVAWTAERPGDVMYYANWRSPFQAFGPLFESIPGLHVPVWSLLLLALTPLCLLQRGAFRKRAWPIDAAILVSVGTIVLTFAWGLLRGGSAYQSYYQLRSFLTALLVGALLLSVVRGPRDLKAVGLTVLAAALVRGTLASYFFVVHVWGQDLHPYPMYMTSHADSLLFVSGVLVAVAWALARMTWWSWALAALVFVHLVVAMKVNNRRLAWVELLCIFAFAYLLAQANRGLRRRLNRLLLLAAPLVVIYVVLGWGRGGTLFAPLRAISTTSGNEVDPSTLAREEENLNLVYTFQQNPLLGTGWGHPYAEVSSRYTPGLTANFWQYPYLPHNSLLGIAAFSGLCGLFGIWLVVPMTAFLAARAYRHATLGLHRAAALAAFCILPAYGVDSFGDVGFQGLTSGLLLAVAMTAAGKVSAWTGAWPSPRARASQSSGPAHG
jgi:hypothetical protein